MEGTVGAKAVDMARKAAPALKRAGRAGNVLSFGISAHEQWEKDSHDPSTGDHEGSRFGSGRLGRRTRRSQSGGRGRCVRRWSGGGAVGGIVGEAVGSGAGGWIADHDNKGIHGIAKWFH